MFSKLRWKIAQAAEIRWWQSYLRKQEPIIYLGKKREYWNRVLRQAAFIPKPGSKVLDAGCGPAGIFMVLKNVEIDALDPLLDAYEANLPHFNRSDYPQVNFIHAALENLEAENTYDTIFCLNAINHVANIELAMDRLICALKPGGQLLLSIDTHNYEVLKKIFRLLPGDILHPHQYDLDEYRNMLQSRECAIQQELFLKKGQIFNYHLLVAFK
ncbi:MAG: hypothetical protein DHS20C18_08660 [Saprospiraceae bacterium]|nr:MAG: hypothetical protein DHS20C18_08660 [Saprospiraceae bacterium]